MREAITIRSKVPVLSSENNLVIPSAARRFEYLPIDLIQDNRLISFKWKSSDKIEVKAFFILPKYQANMNFPSKPIEGQNKPLLRGKELAQAVQRVVEKAHKAATQSEEMGFTEDIAPEEDPYYPISPTTSDHIHKIRKLHRKKS